MGPKKKKIVKLVLIDPVSTEGYNYEGTDVKPPAPNMGLLYLATYVSNHCGAKVKIIDMSVSNYDKYDVLKLIEDIKPDIAGLTSKTFNILGAYEVAETVKTLSKEIQVIIGGSHPLPYPKEPFRNANILMQ